jgi:hypothetical protein
LGGFNHADDPFEVVMAPAQPKPDFERERRAASSALVLTTLEGVQALPVRRLALRPAR